MVENRKCRDVLFLLVFAAYWAGMFVVAGIAFQQGDWCLSRCAHPRSQSPVRHGGAHVLHLSCCSLFALVRPLRL
jgi:hypothetical protein